MGVTMTAAQIEAHLISDRDGEIPIPVGRKALALLFASRGYTSGVEVGVWHGTYSARLKEANPNLRLLCVDAWESFHGYIDSKTAYKSPGLMADAEKAARELLGPMGCEIRKGQSEDIAATVPDRSLDFTYIDANHSYESVLDDLRAWSPKVKVGGIIAGHDYCVNPAKPFIQVIPAVKLFAVENRIRQWFVLAADRTPSFLLVNP